MTQFRFFEVMIPLQYIATFIGSIMIISCGMLNAWTTQALPKLLDPNSKIKFTSSDGSWMAVMSLFGEPIGNIVTMLFVNRIGRKKTILLVSPIYLSTWVLIACAQEKYFFYLAKVIGGIGDGIVFSAFPMYVGEIADPHVRGMLGSTMTVTLVLGFLLSSIIGPLFTIRDGALISTIFPIMHFILFYFMPESPYYFLIKSQQTKATQSLLKLRGHQNISEELDRLSNSVTEDNNNKVRHLDLFTVESNRKAFYVICIMRTLQQFGGKMAITFYATIIFDEAGTNLSSSTCTNIYFSIQLVSTILCCCLVDRLGRKPLMIWSAIVSCLCLAILGGYFNFKNTPTVNMEGYKWIPLADLSIYVMFFNIGMWPIPTTMLGEVFPTSIKAVALSVCGIYNSLAVLLATKFFQITSDDFGISVPFYVFSGCCAAMFMYTLFWFPETKGRTLEEIQEYFKGHKIEKL